MNFKTFFEEARSTTDPARQLRLFNFKSLCEDRHYHLAQNSNLIPELQLELIKIYGASHLLSSAAIKSALLRNYNLIPEIFAQLFIEFKDIMDWEDFEYKNPATQKLLETALLLQ